jgi:hypothetical protein
MTTTLEETDCCLQSSVQLNIRLDLKWMCNSVKLQQIECDNVMLTIQVTISIFIAMNTSNLEPMLICGFTTDKHYQYLK